MYTNIEKKNAKRYSSVLLSQQLSVLHVICPTLLDCVMSGLLDITTILLHPAVYTSGMAAVMATPTTLPLWRSVSRHARTRGQSPRRTAPSGVKSGLTLTCLIIPTVVWFSQGDAGRHPEMCKLTALITGKSAVQEPSAPSQCPPYLPEEPYTALCLQRWLNTHTPY